MKMKKVLLYSGGMDSWLIDKIWNPDIKVYVNMHTRYSNDEIAKLPKDVTIVDFPLGQWERDDAIIPLRNLYLMMVICNITGSDDIEICIGATAGDRVLDKSLEFRDKCEEILNYLYQPQHWIPSGKIIKLNFDFKKYTKTELISMYINQGGDIKEAFDYSFSCYNPQDGRPCWSCKPCFRKFVSFALNNYSFPQEVIDTCLNYIKSDILPQIENGTYGRKQEEQEILKVLELYDNK